MSKKYDGNTKKYSAELSFAGDDDYTPEDETIVYKIGNITEFSFTVNGQRYIPYCQWGVLYNEKNFKNTDKDSSNFNLSVKTFLKVLYSSVFMVRKKVSFLEAAALVAEAEGVTG